MLQNNCIDNTKTSLLPSFWEKYYFGNAVLFLIKCFGDTEVTRHFFNPKIIILLSKIVSFWLCQTFKVTIVFFYIFLVLRIPYLTVYVKRALRTYICNPFFAIFLEFFELMSWEKLNIFEEMDFCSKYISFKAKIKKIKGGDPCYFREDSIENIYWSLILDS